ncbi:hypothetical protein OBBRIDRAFT_719569 [Obba rivulosa]|uniref:SET domain-containing protein n=1 Tax=Obba rivulosa TaxID=1052685 RepID=A0A8E2DUS3_9APHY|nr:hypothetical protein OBBRIDRAFT_719569 [Obba rivulosa]
MNLPADPALLMALMRLQPDDLRAELEGYAPHNGTHRSNPIPPPIFSPNSSPDQMSSYIKEYKAWFEADKRIPPQPAYRLSRLSLITQQHASRQFVSEFESRDSEVIVQMTITGLPKHSSMTPVWQLQGLHLSDMMIRKTHIGRYLICRTVAPLRSTAVQLVVEDPDGACFACSIYNFPTASTGNLSYLDDMFPIGLIMLIREPTYKAATQGPNPIIRVDSPSDIFFVDSGSTVFRDVVWRTGRVPNAPSEPDTVEQWKAKGNSLFKAARWFPAAFAYSRGLKMDPTAIVLRLNRAEAYLRLGFYTGAAADASDALKSADLPDTLQDKALYRLAKAEYGRGRWTAAIGMFDEYFLRHPEDKEAADCLSRAKARLAESDTGSYDWCRLFQESQKDPHIEAAEYRGPIKVQQFLNRGGGRGIIATRDVCAGELLVRTPLVSKPFIAVYPQDLPPNRQILTLDMIASKQETMSTGAAVSAAIQKIYGNPDLHDAVYHLYAGPSYPPPPPSYRLESSPATVPVDPLAPAVDVDVARLEAIYSHNAFRPEPLAPVGTERSEQAMKEPSGLYLLPSLFNHSCVGNAAWTCIGDLIVIRAFQTIKVGDEVTISYRSGEMPYAERAKHLKKYMPSGCDCWLCEDDRKDGENSLQRRHDLIEALKRRAPRGNLNHARTMARRIDATYAVSRGPVRPETFWAFHTVAREIRSLDRLNMLQKAIAEEIKALESLGYVIASNKASSTSRSQQQGDTRMAIDTSFIPTTLPLDYHIRVMLLITRDFIALGKSNVAASWLRSACWSKYFIGLVKREINSVRQYLEQVMEENQTSS